MVKISKARRKERGDERTIARAGEYLMIKGKGWGIIW